MKRFFLMLTGCAVLLSTACGGGDGGTGQPDGGGGGEEVPSQPTTLTVSGKVLDAYGKPLANATVMVLGKTSVMSEASGAFSVPDVQAPYDIIAVRGDKQAAILYKGVTRKDPTLSIPLDASFSSEPAYAGKITGKVTGARTPSATVTAPAVFFASATGSSQPSQVKESDPPFSVNVTWNGSTSLSGSLFAFQGEQTSADGVFTRYTGFGRRDNVTLGNGATLANQDIALSPVQSSNLAGKVSTPSDLTLALIFVNMQVSPGLDLLIGGRLVFGGDGLPPDFNYPVPVVSQTTFSILSAAYAQKGGSSIGFKAGLLAGATNASLDLKAPPTPDLPADKATGVAHSTEFSWSGAQGSVNLATFTKKTTSITGKQFSITVVTSDSRATLPDLSALGMALPANTDFTWETQSISPLTSVDSMLVPRLKVHPLLPSGFNESYVGVSAKREFKTAPAP